MGGKRKWLGWWTELRFLLLTYLLRLVIWVAPANHPEAQTLIVTLCIWASRSQAAISGRCSRRLPQEDIRS